MYQSEVLRQRSDTRDELGFGEEMVLVKMLMEIDPLSMRGSLVMMMASMSPSRREVFPAEQLRRSPRLVLPRFHLETAALRPESFLLIFFQVKTHHIVEDGHRGPAKWPTRQGGAPTGVGRAPTLVAAWWGRALPP